MQKLEQLRDRIERVEKLYTDELMKSHDALEGLTAFVEKRKANWENK